MQVQPVTVMLHFSLCCQRKSHISITPPYNVQNYAHSQCTDVVAQINNSHKTVKSSVSPYVSCFLISQLLSVVSVCNKNRFVFLSLSST